MKWNITVETPNGAYEFDIACKAPGEAFIPLLRRLDALGVSQDNVVMIYMERKND